MTTRKRVTVEQLPLSASGEFLYCRECGAEFSATRGDYFWMRPGSPMTCEGSELLGTDHDLTNLRLVRRRSRLVPA